MKQKDATEQSVEHAAEDRAVSNGNFTCRGPVNAVVPAVKAGVPRLHVSAFLISGH